ncbi:hypothetical protein [Streptomyces rhizosphaerihabitans]|uniref:hypothetical protein n=1 Tax=Streptomyces rhizosphaerihabitans TaxID=1266770 RepID=UPI0021BF1984|nr:hypothetical protein [Streptomyces rhizosphaerihabitans]MCT9003551.1 hypothetical protein [Streptomyces rhizosphaerihabitans]
MSSDMSLIVQPAGRDYGLRTALEDLQLGRWRSMRDLLWATGADRALRTSRSQILAVGAANSDAVTAWWKEEPDNSDALMMWARVQTQRALNASRAEVTARVLLQSIGDARRACRNAAQTLPNDPVPWVCRLALAQLDVDRRYMHRPEHWGDSPDALLPPGPWPLLWEVVHRDPDNREGYHRMLQCFQARGQGALDFARWTALKSHEGSALLVLPLYAFVESYRQQLGQGGMVRPLGFWTSDQVRYYADRALEGWFEHAVPDTDAVPESCSALDLNYLAYVLTASGKPGAGPVFNAIGPYATSAPWAQLSEGRRWWEHEFTNARDYALKQAYRR